MLLTLIIKGTLVLIVAFTVAFALWRGSAAMRHLVWTGAFVCLLVLPLLREIAPAWRVAVPTPAMHGLSVIYEDSTPARASVPRQEWHFNFMMVWYAGITLAMVRLLVAFLRLRRLRMAARPVQWKGPPGPRLLESDQIDLPITFGILRPVIVFPFGAVEWPAERLRLVLAHELAHVRRFDCLTQLLAELVCVVYWFHPFVWLAASQSRKERERACDDAVLNQGTKSSDYAEHLLGVVRSVRIQGAPVAMAISIHSRDLQERLRAVLKPHVNRRAATPKLAAAIAVIALCIIVPIATIRAQGPESTGNLAGSVLDPSRAAVPHAIVTVSGLDSHNKEVAYSGEDGTYALHSLPAGRYVIEVRKPGFAVFEKQVTLAAGQSSQINAAMELGRVSENVDVAGRSPPRQLQRRLVRRRSESASAAMCRRSSSHTRSRPFIRSMPSRTESRASWCSRE